MDDLNRKIYEKEMKELSDEMKELSDEINKLKSNDVEKDEFFKNFFADTSLEDIMKFCDQQYNNVTSR